jgi:hypothetical protein
LAEGWSGKIKAPEGKSILTCCSDSCNLEHIITRSTSEITNTLCSATNQAIELQKRVHIDRKEATYNRKHKEKEIDIIKTQEKEYLEVFKRISCRMSYSPLVPTEELSAVSMPIELAYIVEGHFKLSGTILPDEETLNCRFTEELGEFSTEEHPFEIFRSEIKNAAPFWSLCSGEPQESDLYPIMGLWLFDQLKSHSFNILHHWMELEETVGKEQLRYKTIRTICFELSSKWSDTVPTNCNDSDSEMAVTECSSKDTMMMVFEDGSDLNWIKGVDIWSSPVC